MNRLLILSALVTVCLPTWAASPAATVSLNNFDANGGNGVPIYYLNTATLAPVGANIFVLVLGGPHGNALRPITDINGNPIVIPVGAGGAGPGFFDAGAGLVPGVQPSATATFQVEVWQGTGGYPGNASFQSVTWTQGTGSWSGDPLVPVTGPTLATPSMMLFIPEPSTLALGLLGGLALLLRRK